MQHRDTNGLPLSWVQSAAATCTVVGPHTLSNVYVQLHVNGYVADILECCAGQLLAGLLGWPQATFASKLELSEDGAGATVTREVR